MTKESLASPSLAPASLASASLASASSLVLLQLFTRGFTFGLNQVLVRLASPQTFGTAAIQFELLLSTILFLSREGVRNALLRSPTKSAGPGAKNLVSNISLLPVFLGIPIATLASLSYIQFSSISTHSQSNFTLSVTVYALAAFLELLSEPLYIRAQNELKFDVRIRAEGAAVISKTLVTFLVLAFASSEWALFAFAAGQAAYAIALLAGFVRVYAREISLVPQKVTIELHGNTKDVYFDPDLLNLSIAMTGQSVVKHFLTEGDKFMVSRLSPLADQGGYAIASNYGSLVARIIFQPIEETSRLFFSKSLAAPKDSDSLQTASKLLTSLLLLFTHLLLLLSTFGPPYLPLVTTVLLPPRFQSTSAPAILRTYIFYIPMMAFNGVLEAFFASTATPADLRSQSRWMMAFSVGFVFAAVVLNRAGFGDSGLVYANILNLCARVIYCWNFIKNYFITKGGTITWMDAMPPKGVLGVFALSAMVTRWSWSMNEGAPVQITQQKGHLAVGVGCVAFCLCICLILEQIFFKEVFQVLKRRK